MPQKKDSSMCLPTFLSNTLDILALFDSEVPEDGENDEAGEETGETVDHWRHDGVSVAVVVEGVVASQCQQNPESRPQREENLLRRFLPHLYIPRQFAGYYKAIVAENLNFYMEQARLSSTFGTFGMF